ncbi:zinc ribbon domain-containing protein [Polynucleobacter paneuropaeus]|jgi:hypothetical protein|nr:zinc ribbon domain-containing protein [Polynucleobacter paneuropaeus]MBT8576347.1 zinc ribbon domain-containing protein [Polynucleobacter paneuropaeus]
MALIKCRECGNDVSSEAKTCPKCGIAVKPSHLKRYLLAGASVVILVVFWASFSSHTGDQQISRAPNWKLLFSNTQTGFSTYIDLNSIKDAEGGSRAFATTVTSSPRLIDAAQILQDPKLNGLKYKSIVQEREFFCSQKMAAIKSLTFRAGEMGAGEKVSGDTFDTSKTKSTLSDEPESQVAFQQACKTYFDKEAAKEKRSSLSNKTMQWGSPAVLEGVIQTSTFMNCCFNGVETRTAYKRVELAKKVNFAKDGQDETAGELLNVEHIALLGGINLKAVDGTPVKIQCTGFAPGFNGHYALPVNCVDPKLIN